MAKQTANQQVKAALATGGNNKLTKSEISNLAQAGIGMDKILTVAARNSATIGQQAQSAFNIDQNKQGAISYTPGASPMGGVAPQPGSGWAITGSQTVQTTSPSSGSSKSQVPTYTYMAPTTTRVTQAAGPYNGMMDNATSEGGPKAPGSGDPNVTTPTGNWWDSITEGINGVLTTITNSINQNNANNDLYMGDIRDLIAQMGAAPAQQTIAPYAVTTSNNAPAQGAQMTQAISRRLKNLNTSLAIAPSESAAAGTGLNIAV